MSSFDQTAGSSVAPVRQSAGLVAHTTAPQAQTASAHNPMTLGWVLKRAALYVAILAVAFGSIAWLTYASTEQIAIERQTSKTAGAQ